MICVKNEMPSASGSSVVVSGALLSTLNEAEEFSEDFVNPAGKSRNQKIGRRAPPPSNRSKAASSTNTNNGLGQKKYPTSYQDTSVASSTSKSTSSGHPASSSSYMCQNVGDDVGNISSSEEVTSTSSTVVSSTTSSGASQGEIRFNRSRTSNLKIEEVKESNSEWKEGQNSFLQGDQVDDGGGGGRKVGKSGLKGSPSSSSSSSFDLECGGGGCAVGQSFREPRSPSVGDSSSSTIDSSVSEELKDTPGVYDFIYDDVEDECMSNNDSDDDDGIIQDSDFNSGSSARTLGFSLDQLKKWKIQNELGTSTSVKNNAVGETSVERSEKMSGSKNNNENGIKFAQLDEPKIILFDRERVKPGWKSKMPIGCGFINLGNSCYLNATLQALFHTPAFINWLLDDEEHRRHCQSNSQSVHQCIICPMANTAFEAYSRNSQSMRPILIHEKLKIIGKTLTSGRQEDAHEFMRLLLESMEDSYLTAVNGHKLDSRSKETTPLGQIFGGYYRDEVTCLKCRFVSTTFHPQAELQLDIRNVGSIEDGIAVHFKRESLENNDYRCEKCSTIEPATKQHFLEMAPVVLCVQLKRFRQHGTKITKPIHINKTLNLTQYIHPKSPDKDSDASYRLVGLISHIGTSPNCGHYTAIAEAQNGMFYHFDDSCVRLTNLTYNQNSDAYVVIYEMNQNPVFPSDKEDRTGSMSVELNPAPAEKVEIEKPSVLPLQSSETRSEKSQNDIKPSRTNISLPSVFSPNGVLTTQLYDMTVDEIIDKWCTPSKSQNLSGLASAHKDLASKNVTVSTDMNRNQIVSERKRFLPHVSDDLESRGTKEKKSRFSTDAPLKEESGATGGGASEDEDDEREDLIK